VTFSATYRAVGTQEWETGLPVHGGRLNDFPGFRGVALFTISSKGLVVKVFVAIHTILPFIFKNKCNVALLAIYDHMLTFQLKIGGGMIKLYCGSIHLPILRGMALRTIHFELLPVRGALSFGIKCYQQDNYRK